MKVIIDFVPNHSSDQHPWFLESRASRDNPKRDWYTWRDAKPDGQLPNNWTAAFGGPAWTLDEVTGQYYLHSFLPQQPDLNWRNPEVKSAMLDAMRFWLERGVDGFRLDVAHYLMKHPDLEDNPPNPDYKTGGESQEHKALGEHSSQLHVNDRGHADIHPLYREIRQLLDSYSESTPRVMIGEIHEWDPVRWAAYYGVALDELHLPFNFGLLKTPWTRDALAEHVATIEFAVPKGGWPNYVFGNHDEHRIATRLGPERARAVMMLLLTLRGTPTMYYGDELGMENVEIPADKEQDPWGIRVPGLGLGRDPERTPMQWDASPSFSFTAPGVEPWLPFEDVAATRNVATERDDSSSMLTLTRELLALRSSAPALNSGDFTQRSTASDSVFIFERSFKHEHFLIAINLGSDEQIVEVEARSRARIVLSTLLDRSETVELSQLKLRSNEGLILRLTR